MAKILFLSHRVPYPPNKGDKIRSFNEIRHLARRHEIHLLAFYDYPEEAGYKKDLLEYCQTVTLIQLDGLRQRIHALNAMLGGRPWSLGYYSDASMRRAFHKLAEAIAPEVVFVYCSSMAPYALQTPGIARILDFVDSDALKWRQYSSARKPPLSWLYGYESRKLLQFEHRMFEEFDCSIFVSRSEIAGHSANGLNNKIAFIQNGIDLEFFDLLPPDQRRPVVSFAGAMDYYPNIDAVLYFAHEIFPKIRKVHTDTQFIIIGSRPAKEVRKLASLPGITVTELSGMCGRFCLDAGRPLCRCGLPRAFKIKSSKPLQ